MYNKCFSYKNDGKQTIILIPLDYIDLYFTISVQYSFDFDNRLF